MNLRNDSWIQTTLGDFISLQRGHDLTQEERQEGHVPVMGAAGQNGFHNKAIASGPGIVVGRSGGSFGQVHFVNEDYWPHNTALYVTDFKGNDPCFVYYLLNLLDFSSLNSGSAQPSLNRNYLYPISINVPNPSEQQRISKVLSDLDSKIELNNKINAELEAMAKLIYDYWFVQFDFPNAKGKPYKSSGGKMIWSEELKREVPQGWKVVKMADWIDSNKSGDWGNEEPEGNYTEKVTCIRGTDINGLNGLDELKPPIRYILEKNAFKFLKSHDIIIEISGGSPTQSTGRLAFITEATIKRFETPLICSNFCKPLSMKNEKLLYNFVYYWNSLYDNGVFFGYEGKTSGIKNLLLDSFINSYYTVVPDDRIVNQFYDFMENIQNKKQTALAENQKLSELRDWLLPMLMNGQVKVGEAEHLSSIALAKEEELAMAAEPEVRYERKKS
jgi:type I restriction enzyme S subunit